MQWQKFRTPVAEHEILIAFDVPLSEKLSLEESLSLISKQGYQRILSRGRILRIEEAGQYPPTGHNPRSP